MTRERRLGILGYLATCTTVAIPVGFVVAIVPMPYHTVVCILFGGLVFYTSQVAYGEFLDPVKDEV